MDRLAREGRRFADAHSASAVCTPSRYALLTGEYAFRKDIWGPAPMTSPLLIDSAKTTVASLLKRQGYATACFGKWHLGFGSHPKPDWNADLKPEPLELGFDHYFGIPVVNSGVPHVWVEDHLLGGPSALKFAGETNSDIAYGKIKADAPTAQLYDLEADRSQSRNIIREHPEQAERLAKHLADLRQKPRSAPPFSNKTTGNKPAKADE